MSLVGHGGQQGGAQSHPERLRLRPLPGRSLLVLNPRYEFIVLLFPFFLEDAVPVEKLMDLGSDSVFKTGHSQVGSGFFQRSLWLEGWGVGCRRGAQEKVATRDRLQRRTPKPKRAGGWASGD